MFVADTNLTLLKNDITIAIIILVRDRSYHFGATGKWGNRENRGAQELGAGKFN
jgi:hypothetical protein